MAKPRRITKRRNIFIGLKIFGLLFSASLILTFSYVFLKPNVNIQSDYCFFYIPVETSPQVVYDSLRSKQLLRNNFTFWITQKLFNHWNYAPGLYQLSNGWGNLWVLKEFEEGNLRDHYILQIRPFTSRAHTIKSICSQAGISKKDFSEILQDSIFLKKEFKLNKESVYCIFLPGTYRIYKGRSSRELLKDIYSEYRLFWNANRRKQVKKIKYSPEEVIKLASIVYAETKDTAEMPVIAGLYLNRLEKNIRLQADPTLVFARKASGIKRVYFKYKNSPSPYNTYKFKGLPPGPIGPAPIVAIESVLKPTKHNYLYFCAKEDRSGCHYFSENFEEHKKYARRYRSMLDRRKIK